MAARKTAAGLVMACAAMLATGCGLGAGTPSGELSLRVTENFGTQQLGHLSSAKAGGEETAMRQLQRGHSVGTRFSGRFVQSVNGKSAGNESGKPVDWFFFVNGVESPTGAAETVLHAGDSVWWDRRDWSQAVHVPAVVGSWPQPFRSGLKGKRLPVRIICAPGFERECDAVEALLAKQGVTASRGLAGIAGRGSGLRLLVGDWKALGHDPTGSLLESGPGLSGVYAKPSANGQSIALLNAGGQVAAQFGAGSGLVAATNEGDAQPTWIVSGTDHSGVGRAISALNASTLASRYAVVIAPDGSVHPAPETN